MEARKGLENGKEAISIKTEETVTSAMCYRQTKEGGNLAIGSNEPDLWQLWGPT